MAVLASCNIHLRPEFDVSILLSSFSRDKYEQRPYEMLLATLGAGAPIAPFLPISDSIWHLDTECIEDTGDYVRVAERLRTLAQDALPLEDITDHVDLERNEAWLSFRLREKSFHWNATVQDDWLDGTILSRMQELLLMQQTTRRFTYYSFRDEAQDCLIGCARPEELDRLRQATGLNFTWLK